MCVAVNMYMGYLSPFCTRSFGGFEHAVKQMTINKLELQKTRYFTSGTCPLTMELNWMSGEVVKHHE